MVRRFVMLLLVGGSLALSGCNTVKGLGRDIESVGAAGDRAT